jgi:hypothetical protein
MISDETLARAISEGILTDAQADSLRRLQGAAVPPPALNAWTEPAAKSPDDESLRFITGFSDIFVTIGLALFFGATGFFLNLFFGAVGMWIGTAALAWLLAEFFTRSRRMALPSIVLLGIFVTAIFAAVSVSLGARTLLGVMAFAEPNSGARFESVWLAGLATAACAGVHYWRFRVPITVAAAAAALAVTFVGLVSALWPNAGRFVFNGLILLCGLVVFAVAMRFDATDPERVTRRTDIAFWLHLLAAPLIVHPVISSLLKDDVLVETSVAITILGIFLVFAFVAVAIDRRAMLVSGLVYAGIAFGTLLRKTGFSDLTVPSTLLALGIFVLTLSAGWQPLRRAVLRLFPAPILRRLPRPLHRPS